MLRLEARSPSLSPSGHLVFEAKGDLWLSGVRDGEPDLAAGELVQLTSGPEWDRDPVWTTGGTAVVFASDRSGNTDLWRLEVGPNGQPGDWVQLTETTEPETEPAVSSEGGIAFVRGRQATANIWLLSADGAERQLTDRPGAELSPTFSPNGSEIAYVAGRQLRRLTLAVDGSEGELREMGSPRGDDAPDGAPGGAGGSASAGVEEAEESDDEVVVDGMVVAAPAWSPLGDLIAFAVHGGRGGVFVAPPDGRYTNLVSAQPAAPAWSPDGTRLVLAEMDAGDLGYNGDPDRLGDRRVGDVLAARPGSGRLWIMDAPLAVPEDVAAPAAEVEAAVDRETYNAEAFDRVWERLHDLYYSTPPLSDQWQAVREVQRPRALQATAEEELEAIIYEMLAARPPARPEVTGRAAVSSAHHLATAAGIEILELGGNVIDAAVAVSFALGVVEPDASGIGGYGEMVLHLRGMERPVAIEFLTRVPESAGLNNAAYVGSRLPSSGPVLANVPGTVRGMELAWERYGSGEVEWEQLLRPSIRLAEGGFILDEAFTTTLSHERGEFGEYKSSKELFFPDGEPLQSGDLLKNPGLAWTLRQIAEHGADAFYEGEVARRIVEDLRGKGNAVTLTDMARYFAVEREPIAGTYRGHSIYSAVPAAGGGVSLVSKLHLLDNTEPFGFYAEDAAALHALVEAWKLTPSTRGRLADPSLWPVNIEPLIDREAAAQRWEACFDPALASGPAELETDRDRVPACARVQEEVASLWGEDIFACQDTELGCRNSGTTAFTVADADGNIVAVTQTLGTWGGNFYVTPGLGFLYNDKLRSYGSDPSSYGARLPYARHGTSIAPTLIFRGTGEDQQPYLAVGAAGNAWITSAVYQIVTGILDGGLGPQRALEAPRFLVGVRREPGPAGGISEIVVQAEDAISPEVLRQLRAMGHDIRPISLRGEMRMGYGAVVLVEDGRVRAGADPRRSGGAAAIQ